MAKANLVIGLGGSGKGVIEWLKKKLLDDMKKGYSDVYNGVAFLCIDSLAEDGYYQLPEGKHLIDFSSEEFFKLKGDPSSILNALRKGEEENYPYINKFFNKEDALKMKDESCTPAGGLGQNRLCGRLQVFLNIDELKKVINNSITKMLGKLPDSKAIQNDFLNIFLISSQAGGTGSGISLDIANIIKDTIKDRNIGPYTYFIGIIVLPTSFESVINAQQDRDFRDARSFAFTRELVRLYHTQNISIEYTNNIKILNNSGLFDFCFLIDGVNEKIHLETKPPMFGVCPAISDFIYYLIQDPSDTIREGLRDSITKLNDQKTYSKFSNFGISVFEFPDNQVLKTFSYKFTLDLFSKLLGRGNPTNEGETKAEHFMYNSLNFTKMVIDYIKNKSIPIESPLENREKLISLKDVFLSGASEKDQYFPIDQAIKQLSEYVNYTTNFFNRVRNVDVINSCHNEINIYLGEKLSMDINTIWGWINYQSKLIKENFLKLIVNEIKEIFIDKSTGKYRTLQTQPNLLVIAYDFLKLVNDWIIQFKDEILNRLEILKDPKKNPVSIQELDVEKLESSMMANSDSYNKYIQNDYIQKAQVLLECKVWDILLNELKNLSNDLAEISGHMWQLFGDPVQGWKNSIENYFDETLNLYNKTIDIRQKYNVPSRKYFPMPKSISENKLYEDIVISRNYLGSVLKEMQWEFVVPDDYNSYKKYQLLLNVPSDFELKNLQEKNFTIIFTQESKRYKVGETNVNEFIDFSKRLLKNEVSALNIWKLIWYEYNYVEKEKKSEDKYIEEITFILFGASNGFLDMTDKIQTSKEIKSYIIGNLVSYPNPSNEEEIFLDNLIKSIRKRFSVIEADSTQNNRIVALNMTHGVPIYNWKNYDKHEIRFFNWVTNPNNFSIVIFPEEKNAVKIEIERKNFGRPLKCLDPEIVSLLTDLDSLKIFIVSLFSGFLDKRKNLERDKPDIYYVKGETKSGTQFEKDLGSEDDFLGLIKEYLKPDNDILREVLRKIYNKKLENMTKDEISNNLKSIIDKVETISFNLDDKNKEGDLKDVIKVILDITRRGLRGIV